MLRGRDDLNEFVIWRSALIIGSLPNDPHYRQRMIEVRFEISKFQTVPNFSKISRANNIKQTLNILILSVLSLRLHTLSSLIVRIERMHTSSQPFRNKVRAQKHYLELC